MTMKDIPICLMCGGESTEQDGLCPICKGTLASGDQDPVEQFEKDFDEIFGS